MIHATTLNLLSPPAVMSPHAPVMLNLLPYPRLRVGQSSTQHSSETISEAAHAKDSCGLWLIITSCSAAAFSLLRSENWCWFTLFVARCKDMRTGRVC